MSTNHAPCVSRTYRILVVDDAEPVADLLAMLLRSMGHEVHTALDGDRALKWVSECRPDIVFSDISMPKMDGYQLAHHLRGDMSNSNLVLVALSGYGEPDDKARAVEAGFDHFLIKPISELRTLQSVFDAIAAHEVE